MKGFNLTCLSVGLLMSFALLTGSQYFEAGAENTTEYEEIVLSVEGLGCITCEWDIEGKLSDLVGVKEADITSKKSDMVEPIFCQRRQGIHHL